MSGGRREFLTRQEKEMAKRVLDMCMEEKQDKKFFLSVNCVMDRAARYTGLSISTLHRIQKQSKKGALRSHKKKGRTCNKINNLCVDNYERDLIHRCIEEFYLNKKTPPTCRKLLALIKEKIHFPWGILSLRKLLLEMGYEWVESHTKRRILIERPAVTFARSNYLRSIYQYRQDGRKIFFMDETWVDNNCTFQKYWRSDTINAKLTDSNATNRLIIIHAGSRDGFLKGAKLIFECGTATGDYQGQMNSVNFEKWCTEMLIPNLPANSVIVIDDAPYHNEVKNKVPTKTSSKSEMLEWLKKNNTSTASLNMRKDELYRLIDISKPAEDMFRIDLIFHRHGHEVLRIPPYMCDLNPIELAWAKIKRIIGEQNIYSDFSLRRLLEATVLAIEQVSPEDWLSYDDHVISLEENYWHNDGLVENVVDKFLNEVINDDDDDDMEDDDDEEEEEEEDSD